MCFNKIFKIFNITIGREIKRRKNCDKTCLAHLLLFDRLEMRLHACVDNERRHCGDQRAQNICNCL